MLGPEILKPKKEAQPKTSTLTALTIGMERGKEWWATDAAASISETLEAKRSGTPVSNEVLKEENPDIDWEGNHTRESADLAIKHHEKEKERQEILDNTSGMFDKYIVSGLGSVVTATADPVGIALMNMAGPVAKGIGAVAQKVVGAAAVETTAKLMSTNAVTKLASKLLNKSAGASIGALAGESLVVANEDLLDGDYTAGQAIAGVVFGSALFAGVGMAAGSSLPSVWKSVKKLQEQGSEHYPTIVNLLRRVDDVGKDAEKVVAPIIKHVEDSAVAKVPVDKNVIKKELSKSLNDPTTDLTYNPKSAEKLQQPIKKYDNTSLAAELEQDTLARNSELVKKYGDDPDIKAMLKDNDLDLVELKRFEAMANCLGSGGF